MAESTGIITIRVPKSLKSKLENMSRKNQVNLNLLINQILTKNVQWDEHITNMGWLQFNPSTVKEIFNYLDEDEIANLAKATKTDVINGIKFIYGDTNLQHSIEFIDSWLRATNIPFRHTEDTKSHKFIIRHNIGKNWSSFAIKITEEFMEEIGHNVKDLYADVDSYSFAIVK